MALLNHWTHRADDYLKRLGRKRPLAFYRCGSCRKRKVLNRELWEYLRPPKCDYCNKVDWRLDLHRTKEHEDKVGSYSICHCNELLGKHGSYPHRPGSSVWCLQHPTGPTDQDFIERYGHESVQGPEETGIQIDQGP